MDAKNKLKLYEPRKMLINFLLIALLLLCSPAYAITIHTTKNISKLSPREISFCDRVVSKIFFAEGGDKTRNPYGVLGFGQLTKEQARKICRNTVINSYTRWKAQSQEKDFLRFLSLSYCPLSDKRDTKSLNKNWYPNMHRLMGGVTHA